MIKKLGYLLIFMGVFAPLMTFAFLFNKYDATQSFLENIKSLELVLRERPAGLKHDYRPRQDKKFQLGMQKTTLPFHSVLTGGIICILGGWLLLSLKPRNR